MSIIKENNIINEYEPIKDNGHKNIEALNLMQPQECESASTPANQYSHQYNMYIFMVILVRTNVEPKTLKKKKFKGEQNIMGSFIFS